MLVYWHVEKNSVCIYSQLKSCSSSEVAAMLEGLLRHCTTMEVERNLVDSHGQSEVAFGFCKLLNFDLLPRLKAIHSQKLYRPDTGKPEAYSNLQLVLTRPINWDLIRQQYDQMVKYATALRLGTAETEAILRRFTRNNVQHPTYQALIELGKAVKTDLPVCYLELANVMVCSSPALPARRIIANGRIPCRRSNGNAIHGSTKYHSRAPGLRSNITLASPPPPSTPMAVLSRTISPFAPPILSIRPPRHTSRLPHMSVICWTGRLQMTR